MKKESSDAGKRQTARWPFDPMQPGDHEPAAIPEQAGRIQKQTGAGDKRREEKE